MSPAKKISIKPATEVDVAAELGVSVSKSIFWVLRGFRAAAVRYHAAEESGTDDDVSHALAEVLMWLDMLCHQDRRLLGDATVKAMKFARGRSHHHVASVIERPEGEEGRWRWRRPALFPRPDDPQLAGLAGQRAYETASGESPSVRQSALRSEQ